jgi:transposase
MQRRIVIQIRRPVRRRLKKRLQTTRDAHERTRIQIVLLATQGWGATMIAETLQCAPATVVRVRQRFLASGEVGLEDGRHANGTAKADADVVEAVRTLVAQTPEVWGWHRPTWTRELLARAVAATTGVSLSVATIGRLLGQLRARWGMARPTVAGPWSRRRKTRRIRAIHRRLAARDPREVAYYEDEVDIHLNPRIGRDWMLPGQQKTIPTPGKNRKAYVAGALALDGHRLVTVTGPSTCSALFLQLLEKLSRVHRTALRIHLILDNYGIHSSVRVRRYLATHPVFVLHFLPPYTPEANKIERVWREVHANVTRNHRCTSLDQVLQRLMWYLAAEDRRRRRASAAINETRRRAA